MSNKRERLTRLGLLLLLVISLGALAGCGEQEGKYTPPPATIIRGSEQATPTAGQPAAPAQQSGATPAQPAAPAPAAGSTAYPYPAHLGTPGPTDTPEVYPTPGK
jgi:hypothetical protein